MSDNPELHRASGERQSAAVRREKSALTDTLRNAQRERHVGILREALYHAATIDGAMAREDAVALADQAVPAATASQALKESPYVRQLALSNPSARNMIALALGLADAMEGPPIRLRERSSETGEDT